jgi:hypothetical protein
MVSFDSSNLFAIVLRIFVKLMSVYEASAGDVGVGIAVEAKTSWAIIRPPGPLPAPAKFDISIPLEEARVLAKGLANTRLDNAGLASCV